MEINGNTKVQELVDALAHDDVSEETDELTHWGVRGMRWGVRRYQNKDGSLTKAGQKRLKAETEKVKQEEQTLKNRKSVQNKLDKLAARKKAVEDEKKRLDDEQKKSKHGSKNAEQDETKATKKSVKDMGDEELAYKIRRTQMEKQYEALVAEPEPATKGSGFVKDFMNKSAVPAIQEAGKTLIRDSLLKVGKKYLGLEAEKTITTAEKLKEEWTKLHYEDQIKTLKDKAAKAAAEEKAKQEAKEAAKAAKEAAKEAAEAAKQEAKRAEETVQAAKQEATVVKVRKITKDSPIYDAEYTEIVDDRSTSSGKAYVLRRISSNG